MVSNDNTSKEIDIDDLPALSEILKDEKSAKADAPKTVVRRLPRYYRFLREMLNNDILRTSSSELSKLMGVTASQIRQDLNYFGEFGQQGYGYNVKHLYMQISRILGVGSMFSAVVIGTPEFNGAFDANMMFEMRGVRVRGKFAVENGKLNFDAVSKFCHENSIDIAVVNLPEQILFDAVDALISSEVSGILNFSNAEIQSKKISVQNLCPGDSLMMLTYELNEKRKGAE